MTSIFTKIINREISAHIVWEDEEFISFLDIRPVKKGHLLVVPKIEVDKFYDLDNSVYSKLFEIAKILAKKMDIAFQEQKPDMGVKRIALVVEGIEVPHVHVKLIPITAGGEIDSDNAYAASSEELKEMQEFYKSIFN